MGSTICLLLAAAIWGFGFVAQRFGMEHLGPYSFNAIRFFIGAISLLPLLYWYQRRGALWPKSAHLAHRDTADAPMASLRLKHLAIAGIAVGALLFIGASLQQVGLQFTTAAKAGFITGLYLVLVPFFGLWLGHKTGLNSWIGAFIALIGLYFLSVTSGVELNPGDLMMVIGAVFWAMHLLTIDHFVKTNHPVLLAFVQFIVCGLLSGVVALWLETPTWPAVLLSWQPLLYAGVVSVGIGFTLQIIGQQGAHPTHAAIIMSLETVFAAIGGVWLLGEVLDQRAIAGCGLMLFGMLCSQIPIKPVVATS
jgi:drug/metabolite transporter (DMT)-like permease